MQRLLICSALLFLFADDSQAQDSDLASTSFKYLLLQPDTLQNSEAFSFNFEYSPITISKPLFYSLKAFESIKYRSIIEEFNAVPFFDVRKFDPLSVSDYTSHYRSHYFTLQTETFSK